MIKKLAYILCLALVCSTVSCSGKWSPSPVTPGMAKTNIVKGSTTQEDIFQRFGAPNFVTKTRNKGELWVYSNHASASKGFGIHLGAIGGGSGIMGLGGGSGNMNSSSSRSSTLMITFDENDIVMDYTISQLQY